MGFTLWNSHMGLSENVVYPEKPNGFADHYPVFKWLFHWEYTLFSDKPIFCNIFQCSSHSRASIQLMDLPSHSKSDTGRSYPMIFLFASPAISMIKSKVSLSVRLVRSL